jgi:hypothetical protein
MISRKKSHAQGLLFKVAVSDVEESSVMTRLLIAVARIGCVSSAAAIAIISAGNSFRVGLDIIFPFFLIRDNARKTACQAEESAAEMSILIIAIFVEDLITPQS